MAAIVDLSDGLGAVLDLGGTASGLGFLVSLLACAGLGVFALLQQDGSNDTTTQTQVAGSCNLWEGRLKK